MSDFQENNAGIAFSNAVADAVERAASYTVTVSARRRIPLSGVIFQKDLVITADHGIEREENIRVTLPSGKEVEASIAGRDRATDLAVLRLPDGTVEQVVEPFVDNVRVGNLVIAAGRPSTDGIQASMGMVTALGGGLRVRGGVLDRYIVTDAVPLPGFSGGPLADLAGRLLAINTSGLARGALLSIPAALANELAQNLVQHGHIRRGYLGIRSQVIEIPEAMRAGLGRAQESGLLVVGVEAEGPAANSLMVGDIVVGINGSPVSDHDDLMVRLTGDAVGRASELQVLRGGKLQPVSVTIGERK